MNYLQNVIDWFEVRLGLQELSRKYLTGYLLPRNINCWYSLGSVLLVAFSVQVITGILLLINYVPDASIAFKSVTRIMNDVPYGWLIRISHAVGSNLMIAALLLHMLSVLFMGSYKSPRELNWISGFILLNLILGISLTGYLLPWSQLSFWATTVATNSIGVIPIIGEPLVEFVRGGKTVGPPTLSRFFALHVAVLPLVITVFIVAHLFFLERIGVSTPPFKCKDTLPHWVADKFQHEDHPGGIPFFPNYLLQDMTVISIYLAIFALVIFYYPYIFFPETAFQPANPYQTPAHIKPEWYFLANYQTLKLFRNELIGLTVQGGAMMFLAILPLIDGVPERNPLKRPLFLIGAITGILIYLALMIWGYFS